MARGAPDWQRIVQVTFSEGQAKQERGAGGHGRYSGNDQTYQVVKSWTVATGYTGELKEILVLSSEYTKTEVQIVIGAVTWAFDWLHQSAMPIIFEDLRLAEGIAVTVSAKSTDGTAIIVDAIITAKEIG